MHTMKDLRARVEQYGAALRDDGFCLMVEAPPGHTWDGDLHEFVAEYKIKGLPSERRNAIGDLMRRMEQPRPCHKRPNCDWCNPDQEENV